MAEFKSYEEILTPIPVDFDVPFLRNEIWGYHYTSVENLSKIAESRQLRFSSLADVNDSAEIADGVAVWSDFIRRFPKKGERDDARWEDLREKAIEDGLETYFVFCLTPDEDSLPMWECYAGIEYGCCLGFNYSELIRSLLAENFETLKGGSISYGFVVYNRREKIRIFKTLLKGCGISLSSVSAKFFNEEVAEIPIRSAMLPEAFRYYENDEAGERCFARASADLAFSKNRTFRYENELRIAVRIPKERQADLEKSGALCRAGEKTFLCLKFDPARSIKRIYAAPLATPSVKDEIRKCRERFPCLEKAVVYDSESTIRQDTLKGRRNRKKKSLHSSQNTL